MKKGNGLRAALVAYLGLSIFSTTYAVDRLQEFKERARAMEEFVPLEGEQNPMNPDYTSYYESFIPMFFTNWLQRIGLLPVSRWSVEGQGQELGRFLEWYKGEVYEQEKNLTIMLEKESQVYVWANLHGSFHSLIRALDWLHEKGVIDKQLKLRSEHTYFVFNGNAVDLSPHSFETITLICALMRQNPDHVLYLAGQHERDNYWSDYSLNQQIIIRAVDFETEKTILNIVSTFFEQLPHSVRFCMKDQPDQCIEIEPGRSELFNPEVEADKKSKEVVARVVGVDPFRGLKVEEGLIHRPQQAGVTAWGVFSHPFGSNGESLTFKYDALVKLELTKPIERSTITLYNQVARDPKGFKEAASYNLATGIFADETVKSEEKPPIVIGTSMSLIAGVPTLGLRTKLGMDVAINQINEQGGINGRLIKLIVLNDNYIPHMARTNLQYLKDVADLILLPIGSPTIASYLDFIKNNEVFVAFPVTGGPQFRSSELSGTVHLRASYGDEVKALMEDLIRESGVSNFAFFYQKDAYGIGPLEAARAALKENRITKWLELPYTRGTVKFEDQIKRLKEYQPDAIGFFSTANATEEFIRQMGIDTIANKKLFGISFLASKTFRNFVEKHGLPFLFGSAVPNPYISPMPLAREYRAAMDKRGYTYGVFSFEGYMGAAVVCEVLKTIPEPITKEKIKAAFESLGGVAYKGLNLTFDPKTRSLARFVWIETGPETRWKKYPVREETTAEEAQKKKVQKAAQSSS